MQHSTLSVRSGGRLARYSTEQAVYWPGCDAFSSVGCSASSGCGNAGWFSSPRTFGPDRFCCWLYRNTSTTLHILNHTRTYINVSMHFSVLLNFSLSKNSYEIYHIIWQHLNYYILFQINENKSKDGHHDNIRKAIVWKSWVGCGGFHIF